MKKRLIILGSTGSIGTKTLEVVSDFPDQFEIVGLSTNGQTDLLAQQVKDFRPAAVCVTSPEKIAAGQELAAAHNVSFYQGEQGLAPARRKRSGEGSRAAVVDHRAKA